MIHGLIERNPFAGCNGSPFVRNNSLSAFHSPKSTHTTEHYFFAYEMHTAARCAVRIMQDLNGADLFDGGDVNKFSECCLNCARFQNSSYFVATVILYPQ